MVRFLDDDEVICEVTAPPYTCGYRANTGDVGRNTLSAVAVDTAGKTTMIERAVTVSKFSPPLKLTVERGFRLTGRLEVGRRGLPRDRDRARRRRQAHPRDAQAQAQLALHLQDDDQARPPLRPAFRANFAGNALVTPRAGVKSSASVSAIFSSSSRSTAIRSARNGAASETWAPHSTISASG